MAKFVDIKNLINSYTSGECSSAFDANVAEYLINIASNDGHMDDISEDDILRYVSSDRYIQTKNSFLEHVIFGNSISDFQFDRASLFKNLKTFMGRHSLKNDEVKITRVYSNDHIDDLNRRFENLESKKFIGIEDISKDFQRIVSILFDHDKDGKIYFPDVDLNGDGIVSAQDINIACSKYCTQELIDIYGFGNKNSKQPQLGNFMNMFLTEEIVHNFAGLVSQKDINDFAYFVVEKFKKDENVFKEWFESKSNFTKRMIFGALNNSCLFDDSVNNEKLEMYINLTHPNTYLENDTIPNFKLIKHIISKVKAQMSETHWNVVSKNMSDQLIKVIIESPLAPVTEQNIIDAISATSKVNRFMPKGKEIDTIVFRGSVGFNCVSKKIHLPSTKMPALERIAIHEAAHSLQYDVMKIVDKDEKIYIEDRDFYRLFEYAKKYNAFYIVNEQNYHKKYYRVVGHPEDNVLELFASTVTAYMDDAEKLISFIRSTQKLTTSIITQYGQWHQKQIGIILWCYMRDRIFNGEVFTSNGFDPFAHIKFDDLVKSIPDSVPFADYPDSIFDNYEERKEPLIIDEYYMIRR